MGSPATATGQEKELQQVMRVGHDPELARWQRRLLPVMTIFVIALALAFFVVSSRTLSGVGTFVEVEHNEVRDKIQQVIDKSKQPENTDDVLRRGLLILEADALDRRYHQANALLMSQIWAKHLAFMTGMIMAFLGAIFILGKLSESPSNVAGGNSSWSISITSASPGILLSFFGTSLVALSIVIQGRVDVRDGSAYLRSVVLQPQAKNNGSGKAMVNSDTAKDFLSESGIPIPTPAPNNPEKK